MHFYDGTSLKVFSAQDVRNSKFLPSIKYAFQKKRRGRKTELGLIFPFFPLKAVDCLHFTREYFHLLSSGSRGPGGCPQLLQAHPGPTDPWGGRRGSQEGRRRKELPPVALFLWPRVNPSHWRVEGVASHLSWQLSFSGSQVHTLQGATCSLCPGGEGRQEV